MQLQVTSHSLYAHKSISLSLSFSLSLPLLSLAERRLVAHTPSVKADLFRVQQSAVLWISLFQNVTFYRKRSDAVNRSSSEDETQKRNNTCKVCEHANTHTHTV